MSFCPVNLNGIAGSCDTSFGGLQKVYITTFDDGLYTLNASGDSVSAVSTGATWYEYSFKKGVCSQTSTQNVDNANGVNYVTTEVVLQFNRMDTAKRKEIAALSTGDLAVITKDSNGKYWALGFSEPVNASAGTAQTGQAKSDGNFYQITLSDDQSSYPYEIPQSVIDTLNIAENA